MAEKFSEKPHESQRSQPRSFFAFWGLAIKKGCQKSREKFGGAIELASFILGIGLLGVAWYSQHHKEFNAARGEEFVNYWTAIIPLGVGLLWLFYHILKAPHEIYLELHKKLQNEIERNAPKFKLSCRKDITGCAIENPDGSMKFFRMQVETDCVNGIENCKGHLIRIEKDGKVVYDHDARELPFARADEPDSLAKTISPNVPYFLDVLVTYHRVDKVHFATKGHSPALNEKREYIFENRGEYILTVSVSGKDAPTATAKLKFDWNGQWFTSTIEKLKE